MLDIFIIGVVLHDEPGATLTTDWVNESLDWHSRTKEGPLINWQDAGSPEGDLPKIKL